MVANNVDDRKRDERDSDDSSRFIPMPLLAFWLARQHTFNQEAIADKVEAGLNILWPILQANDLDKSTPVWLHATTLEIEKGWKQSVATAFEYVQEALWAVEPDAPLLARVEIELPVAEVQTALRVTGPIEVKKQIARAVPEVDAMRAGRKASTGTGFSKALDGGRRQVMEQVVRETLRTPSPARDRQWASLQAWREELVGLESQGRGDSGRAGRLRELIAGADPALQNYVPSADVPDIDLTGRSSKPGLRLVRPAGVVGFARQTDSDPCYFCALLASLGAVFYNGDSFKTSNDKIRNMDGVPRAFFGDGVAKVHDHCKCTLRPVFREEDSMDERAKYFLDQWYKFSDGLSGKDALKNFRNNYVLPPPYKVGLNEVEQVLADLQHNRDLLLDRGFKASSPNVRFIDRSMKKLERSAANAA